jgi:hypothetical protein
VRDGNIALFAEALGPAVDAETRSLLARTLWLLQLGFILYFIHDRSAGQARTRRLVDGVVDLVAPLVPIASSSATAALRAHVLKLLREAGLAG